MINAVKNHWPEYLIEGAGLGVFMMSASTFAVILFHPDSPLISIAPAYRMTLMGVAMGSTAIAIIVSPWGKRSGAHINPAVTLTFWFLGKVKTPDAVFYVASQFLGATLGMIVATLFLGELLAEPAVNFVVTMPNASGAFPSFIAEFAMSFAMMTTVLWTANNAKTMRFTPFFAGTLVALFITFESPLSGMSLNPARTFGAALVANQWNSIWIYFVAPPLAMLSAAAVYVAANGLKRVYCAKLAHFRARTCIFDCRLDELLRPDGATEANVYKRRAL